MISRNYSCTFHSTIKRLLNRSFAISKEPFLPSLNCYTLIYEFLHYMGAETFPDLPNEYKNIEVIDENFEDNKDLAMELILLNMEKVLTEIPIKNKNIYDILVLQCFDGSMCLGVLLANAQVLTAGEKMKSAAVPVRNYIIQKVFTWDLQKVY